MALRSENVYTFKVAKDATKTEIKKAIEDAFKVEVKSVNTLNTKSKKEELESIKEEQRLIKKQW